MWNEKRYILFRRIKAFGYAILFVTMRVFRIEKNKIVFSSFEGGGFGCNPKYIAEELHRRAERNHTNYKLVWLVNDLNKEFPDYIKKSKNTMFNRIYHLSTAAIWIDNSRQKYGTIKRKKQYYVQTWHGQIGFKPIGKLRKESFSKIADIVSRYDGKMVDCWISNSKWSTETFQAAFYEEPIVKTGSPRCDVLINHRKKTYDNIRQRLNVNNDVKFVMYAPTFRGGSQNTKRSVFLDKFSLDFDQLINCLHTKFNGEWYILIRVHPQIVLGGYNLGNANYGDRIIDVSQYDDMYELMAATDVFITDYSSAAFDAATINVPVFLYADDFDEYMNDRGKLLWNVDNLPFKIAQDSLQLAENIMQFDYKNYKDQISKLKLDLEILEDGHASEKVADIVEGFLKG